MYHSITFGDKNTWDDWHLVPETRPVINPPEPKFIKKDIPFGDGDLDLTNALSPYTYYQNRTGEITFIVLNDLYYQVTNEKEWYVKYTEIMNYLHGKKMRMVLEDDKQYYYIGRFYVSEWESEEHHSKITIKYDLEPYKWNIFSSLDDWLWDPFNFVTGVVPNPAYKNIELPGSVFSEDYEWVTINIDRRDLGVAPVCPTIYVEFDSEQTFIRHSVVFKIPGYEGERRYDQPEMKGGFKIPEFTFRRDMTDEELKIVVASVGGIGNPVLSLEIREGCF